MPGILLLFMTLQTPTAPPSFVDATARAGLDVNHDIDHVRHDFYVAGGAVADFNDDGWQDLFWLSGGGNQQPDRLFINNRDGTFTDRAAEWGIAELHRGKGAAVGDFDNDGWIDLYVTSSGPLRDLGPGNHRLYRNEGGAGFTEMAVTAGVDTSHLTLENGFGTTFGDYDLDGDLDLFVSDTPYFFAGTRLFRNEGDGTFVDVSDASQLQAAHGSFGFSPSMVDMDGDFYPELLLAADFGTSAYFTNNTDGTFTYYTRESGTGLEENGMGQAVGDINNDGRIDWFVTSIDSMEEDETGNKLYINQGNHSYDEVAADVGVSAANVAWGAAMVDFNHDGRLDLAATSGTVANVDTPTFLWLQNDQGTFDEVAADSGLVHFHQGRGMSTFDYDNDGDQDMLIYSYNGPLALFENTIAGSDVNWLRVFLDSSSTPGLAPHGIGAHVIVTAGGKTQHRWMHSGDHYLSHSELSAHFGLGTTDRVDRLEIRWPNGTVTLRYNIRCNQTMTVSSEDCSEMPERRCRRALDVRR